MALLGLAVCALACAALRETPPEPRSAAAPKPPTDRAPAPAKPGAPVDVRASVSGSRVLLELHFASAARDVSVLLTGSGGLSLASDPQPILARSVSAGETLRLEVAVVPGPGHSNLGVVVVGIFGGARRSRATSVGFGALERESVRAMERRDDGRGQPLKVGRGVIR